MKCIIYSKLTVEITQHYRWLCRRVFVVQFEKTISFTLPKSTVKYQLKVCNQIKFIYNKDGRWTCGILIINFEQFSYLFLVLLLLILRLKFLLFNMETYLRPSQIKLYVKIVDGFNNVETKELEIQMQVPTVCNCVKGRLWHRCFYYAKYFRTPLLKMPLYDYFGIPSSMCQDL